MKFGDLIFYFERIKAECSSIEYKNALNSIELSLSYWEQKLKDRNFAQKARQLLEQLKI